MERKPRSSLEEDNERRMEVECMLERASDEELVTKPEEEEEEEEEEGHELR